jgi:pimeloyl-ACP methyl ester carboxylesterase
VLADLEAGPAPTRLKATTPAPARHALRYAAGERDYRAHLYEPGEPPLAAMVLIHGAAEAGPEDPRLVAFAETLARARFRVLVPDIESLRELRVQAGDADAVAHAVDYLSGDPQLAPPGAVGMAAVSYAVGPMLLAALRPGVGERVDFVVGVGGYHSLERVITFFTTGWFELDGERHHRTPNEYGKWLFVRSNAERVDDPGDRTLLQRIAERRLRDPRSDVADLVAQLGVEGHAVHALAANTDPARVPELIERLPAPLRRELSALDLVDKGLPRLRARAILVHGRDDAIIPFSESVQLARTLPRDRARLYLVQGLHHVDIDPGARDLWRLWRAVYALLTERDRVPGERD